jgi:hypothetical protein
MRSRKKEFAMAEVDVQLEILKPYITPTHAPPRDIPGHSHAGGSGDVG